MEVNEQVTENILKDPEISKSLDIIIKIAAEEFIKKIYILEGELKESNRRLNESHDTKITEKHYIKNREERIRALQCKVEGLTYEMNGLKLKLDKSEQGIIDRGANSDKLHFEYQKQLKKLSILTVKYAEKEKIIEDLQNLLKRKEIEMSSINEDCIKIKAKMERLESFASVKDKVAKQMQASFALLDETVEKSKKSIREKDVEISRLQRIVYEHQVRR